MSMLTILSRLPITKQRKTSNENRICAMEDDRDEDDDNFSEADESNNLETITEAELWFNERMPILHKGRKKFSTEEAVMSILLNWFSRTNQEPSLWKLSQSSGISKHPGSKPGQQHKRGKKSTSALPSKRTKFTIPSVSSTPSVIPAISECNVHVDHPPIITSVPSISVNSPITGPSISIASSTQPHMSFPAVPSISIVSPITAPSISIASTVMPSSGACTSSSSGSHFSISFPDNSVLSNTSMPVNHIMSMSPFNAKFITDRIMKCQGCRKNFRSVSGSKLPPPLDLIVSRMERRPFVRPDGSVHIPTNHSNSHYHLSMACLKAASPGNKQLQFVVPDEIIDKLSHSHKLALFSNFGIRIQV
jgi:hypothetical protein